MSLCVGHTLVETTRSTTVLAMDLWESVRHARHTDVLTGSGAIPVHSRVWRNPGQQTKTVPRVRVGSLSTLAAGENEPCHDHLTPLQLKASHINFLTCYQFCKSGSPAISTPRPFPFPLYLRGEGGDEPVSEFYGQGQAT